LGAFRLVLTNNGPHSLSWFISLWLIASGCAFAAGGFLFGRVAVIVAFFVGTLVGSWLVWRIFNGGL
jgi:hypothetical protein